MKKRIKIVIIGAGGKEFTRGIIHDLLLDKELNGTVEIDVVLVDIDNQKLDLIYNYALRCIEYTQATVNFSKTTDRQEALVGADFVMTSIAIKRMELWEQDFRIALSFGIKHVFGENGGPAALFHALRNFKIIMPICRDIEKICPDALLLNFTNPESRILTAILSLTKLKAIGLCHGFYNLRHLVTKVLDRPEEELDIRSAGMNHFYTAYKIYDRQVKQDILELFMRKLAEQPEQLSPLTRYFFEKFGVIGMVSDDHVGEYIGYAHEFMHLRWMFGLENRKAISSEQPVTLEDTYMAWGNGMDIKTFINSDRYNLVNRYLTGDKPLDDDFVKSSGELAVPIIGDIVLDRKSCRPAVNILNTEGYIDNLARDGCIEVPATVDKDGVHPEYIGSLPEGFAAHIRLQHSIQKLLVQAFAEKSRKLLLQALLLDPVVDSAVKAEKYLDYMLNIQMEYLPELSS